MTTVKRVRDALPNSTIKPIVSQPGYETIKAVHKQLNDNAVSINIHLGNGRIGLLFLTVQPVVYNTLSHLPFVPPVHPDQVTVYPLNPTQQQIIVAKSSTKQTQDFSSSMTLATFPLSISY